MLDQNIINRGSDFLTEIKDGMPSDKLLANAGMVIQDLLEQLDVADQMELVLERSMLLANIGLDLMTLECGAVPESFVKSGDIRLVISWSSDVFEEREREASRISRIVKEYIKLAEPSQGEVIPHGFVYATDKQNCKLERES